MRGNCKNLHFYDAYSVNDTVYCSSIDYNSLFAFNINESEAHLIGYFDNEFLTQEVLHRDIIASENNLFFIPYRANGIGMYNLKKNELERPPELEYKKGGFSGVFSISGGYLLVPTYLNQDFIEFSPREIKIKKIPQLSHQISSIRLDSWSDARGSCRIDENTIAIAFAETDIIALINLRDYSVKSYRVSEFCLANLFWFKNRIWATELRGNRILSFDPITKQKKEYDVDDMSGAERPHFEFASQGETLFLLPCLGEWIWKYDETNDRWKRFINLNSIKEFKRELPYTLFFGWTFRENYLILYPRSGNGILKINVKNGLAEVKKICISPKLDKKIAEDQKKEKAIYTIKASLEMYGILPENEKDFTIENYLDYICSHERFSQTKKTKG